MRDRDIQTEMRDRDRDERHREMRETDRRGIETDR